MERPEIIPKDIYPEIFKPENLLVISMAYGIPNLRFISSPAAGTITTNAILEDGNGKKYFAKQYSSEEIERYAATYRAAELVSTDQEIPVSLPLLPLDNSYTTSINGNSLALFPYVEHRSSPPEDQREDIHLTTSMATYLGKMHSITIPEDESTLQPIARWQPESQDKRKEMLQRLVSHISGLPEKNEFDVFALEAVNTKIALLKNIPGTQFPDKLDTRICHGDYHGHNVLYNDEMEVIAIVDWDNAGLADPHIDLLNTFITNIIGNKFDSYQEGRQEIAREFFRAYQTGTGSIIDIKQLKIAYSALMNERIGTSWPIFQHYFNDDSKFDQKVKHILNRSIAYAERYDEIWDFIVMVLNDTDK